MTLLIFIIVLSILVFVHELGHFLAARRAGIRVDEFGFGFPPRVWGKKIGETIYSINALPVGGFVRLHGEDEAVAEDKERAYFFQGKFTRFLVVVAGVLMNFLLSILAFSIISWHSGVPQETGRVKVNAVATGSPAEAADIQNGDVIVAVDGKQVVNSDEFIQEVGTKRGKEVELTLLKSNQETQKVSTVPRENPPVGEGALGVTFSSKEFVKPPLYKRPFVSIREGVKEAVFWVQTTVGGLATVVSQVIQGQKPEGIAGPIGIFQITGSVAKEGLLPLISLIGILSVNLAVLNILPIPALDGGRLLFIIVEAFFGRKVLPVFEKAAHAVGMILLLLLLILVTLQDLSRIIGGFKLPGLE